MNFLPFLYNFFLLCMGILGIGFLIAFHELGHFLFCKLFNIHTPSFSIGFGPRLLTKKIGSTEFKISAIPLGGYVEIAGSAEPGQGNQQHAHQEDASSFLTKPFWQKFLVLSGGIFFNMIFAYVTFILICMTGIPSTPFLAPLNMKPTIARIEENSVAQQAGLQVGDTILALNNTSINGDVEFFLKQLRPLTHDTINLEVMKQDNRKTQITLTPGEKDCFGEKKAFLGIEFLIEEIPGTSIIESIAKGIHITNRFIRSTVNGFLHLFSTCNLKQMGGPIMIIAATAKGAAQGLKIFFIFLAIISINLAILNIIPLPILDGGQLLFHTIEAIIGRRIPIKIREYIFIGCWIAMLALVVYLSAQDIYRLAYSYIERLLFFFRG